MPDLHDQMRMLHDQIVSLERRLGEVCGDYVEITAALAPFLTRYRDEITRYHKALVLAQRELADVRAYLGDTKAMSHGEAFSPLDEFLKREDVVSVQKQYERVWEGKDLAPRMEGIDNVKPVSKELKELYGKAVAELHPELALSIKERRGRITLFNQVNAAYLRRDVNTVRMAVDSMTPKSTLPSIVDNELVSKMRDRVYMLEELIAKIEAYYYDYRYGDIAKVRAYAKQATEQGKDFIGELSLEIQTALGRTADELAQLKQNIEQQ